MIPIVDPNVRTRTSEVVVMVKIKYGWDNNRITGDIAKIPFGPVRPFIVP